MLFFSLIAQVLLAGIPWGHVSSGSHIRNFWLQGLTRMSRILPWRQNNCSWYIDLDAIGEEVLANYDNTIESIPFIKIDGPRNYITRPHGRWRRNSISHLNGLCPQLLPAGISFRCTA